MLEENTLASKTQHSKTIVNSPEKREWFDTIPGERMAIHVQSSAVGGNLAIMETVAVPGCGSPLHFHRESEIFHILEGTMTFMCGGEKREAGLGTTIVVPPGVHHAWANLSPSQVRMLVVVTPGGIENLFPQANGLSPLDLVELVESYGTRIVGPPILG
jgi:quercetin dioxygenase-like cupin family protein